jgi:hypothetical protein
MFPAACALECKPILATTLFLAYMQYIGITLMMQAPRCTKSMAYLDQGVCRTWFTSRFGASMKKTGCKGCRQPGRLAVRAKKMPGVQTGRLTYSEGVI